MTQEQSQTIEQFANEHVSSILEQTREACAEVVATIDPEVAMNRSISFMVEGYKAIGAYMVAHTTELHHPLDLHEFLEGLGELTATEAMSKAVDALYMYSAMYRIVLCMASMKEIKLQVIADALKKAQAEADRDAEEELITQTLRVWLN